MKKPTLADSVVARVGVVLATVLLAACAGDVTSAPQAIAHPQEASKALVGMVDGVYNVTIDPRADQVLSAGRNSLTIPANSICQLGISKYGPSHWDSKCTPEARPVTITAIVRNAGTDYPSIQFEPAMRFSPATVVTLELFVSDAATLSNMAVVKYCGRFAPSCVDESLTDPSVKTTINKTAGSLSRRIKHFSGYVVSE